MEKTSKFVIYKNKRETKCSDLSPLMVHGLRRAAGTAVPDFIDATDTGRFSFSDNNITNVAYNSNETWEYFKSPGEINTTTIKYKVEGFSK